jgi:hypothetical protein
VEIEDTSGRWRRAFVARGSFGDQLRVDGRDGAPRLTLQPAEPHKACPKDNLVAGRDLN